MKERERQLSVMFMMGEAYTGHTDEQIDHR